MRQPCRTKPNLHDPQAVADTAEHIVVMHLKAIELEFAVSAVLLRAHDLDTADDAPAGLILVEQKRGDALALVV